jgi:type IV secretory pathway VirB4 component
MNVQKLFYSIISDDTSANNEILDFGRYSTKLATLIENSDPKFTVGIFGGWGTGKTTLMNMIMNELEKNTINNIVLQNLINGLSMVDE